MLLTHSFEVAAPVDRVFDVFGRLDLLAPCFPGASVWGRDGEVYHGAVKIKFGPFPLVFEGTARVVRADLAQRRLVVKANARDRRGAAAGAATVTATFAAIDGDSTRVQVASDLELTGRPAQLGSGAISTASDRLADQFVGCIGAKLAAGLVADEPGADESGTGTVAAEPGDAPPTASSGSARSQYAYRPPATSESAPHLQVLPDVARTWLPWVGGIIGGLAVLVLVARRWRRR
jgi:carbon monoxide dehydrogenase subunit G